MTMIQDVTSEVMLENKLDNAIFLKSSLILSFDGAVPVNILDTIF